MLDYKQKSPRLAFMRPVTGRANRRILRCLAVAVIILKNVSPNLPANKKQDQLRLKYHAAPRNRQLWSELLRTKQAPSQTSRERASNASLDT
jgi:hypothetical protein